MSKAPISIELFGGPRDGERFETMPAREYWASHLETWAIYRPFVGAVAKNLKPLPIPAVNYLTYVGSIRKKDKEAYERGEIKLDAEPTGGADE